MKSENPSDYLVLAAFFDTAFLAFSATLNFTIEAINCFGIFAP
jgi:hypothetical protein